MARRFLIDTDTASDDAVALIMAFRAADVEVVAITTVAGNVNVEQAASNALFTAELCHSDVPVYRGASKPLNRELEDATWFHGRDGLGDRGYRPARRACSEQNAIDVIVECIDRYPGIELVTLGPLTNLALALRRNSAIAANVARCVVMGGAPCCAGNVTPAAEYNFWVDPEAAREVLRSALPVELIGWHLSRAAAVLDDADIAAILSFNTDRARFAIDCNSLARRAYLEQTGEVGISLPDPVAMSIALDPAIGTSWSAHAVDVEVKSELTRGMTVVDQLNIAGNRRNRRLWSHFVENNIRAKVCWTLDAACWKSALFQALA